jgi:hypothetical protein
MLTYADVCCSWRRCNAASFLLTRVYTLFSTVKKSVAQREADLVAAGFERITLKPKPADAATGRVDREEDEEGEREEGEKQESPKGRSPGDTGSDTAGRKKGKRKKKASYAQQASKQLVGAAGVPAASAGYQCADVSWRMLT